MEKLRKTIYDVLVFIISLCITGSISVSNIATKDTSHVNLKIDETSQQQEIMGWGAAAAWWPQVAGASENAEAITKLLFSKEGLGLNVYRFNVGSGEKQNPNTRLDRDSWKSTESFLVYNEKTGKYEYDWSQDAESMKILDLAMSYGCVDSVVLFSNSPHFSMTITGQASSGFKKHQNNLKPECYQEYVDYFLDITEHFIELGYPIKYISPVNEPQVSWGGDDVYQEGCHYETEELFKLYKLFAKSIKARGLDVKLSMCEVSKITSKTFDYLKYVYNDPDLREVLGTYTYHSYCSDINYFIKSWWGRYIKKYPGVIYDMSEWCELPVTMSNKSTRSALFMARVMAQDMFISNASFWSAWVAVSEGDENGDGLPNDTWYELKGSEYGKPETTQDYAVTYYRPRAAGMEVQWTDNKGASGSVDYLSQFHTQDYYYPAWVEADSYTLRGTCLKANNYDQSGNGSYWVNPAYDWGYADNFSPIDRLTDDPNSGAGVNANHFRISDAVTFDGKPAGLKYIDFVKVQTGIQAKSGWLGEISTEVFGVFDYNMTKKK